MISDQCSDELLLNNSSLLFSTGNNNNNNNNNHNNHNNHNNNKRVGKLHERLWPNIKLQKWGKNRRVQSVHSEVTTCSLQKCYSDDDSMLNISMNNSVQDDIIYEDHCIVPNIYVRAATIDKLLEELLIHIDHSCNFHDIISEENLVFPKIFFLVHKWFSTSQIIGRKFYFKTDLNCLKKAKFDDDDPKRNSGKIFNVDVVTIAFCLWIEFHPNDFTGSESCMPVLTKFIESLQEMRREDLITTLEKCLNSSYDWSRGLSLRISIRQPLSDSMNLTTNRETCSLIFNKIPPVNLAEQLTVIEFKAFRRITVQDLKMYTMTATVANIPTLERSVYLFNGLSQWVQCMILNKTTPQERAKVIEKFLQIGKHLLDLKNFNSFYAVIGAITHSAISRMNATMLSISNEAQKLLGEFADIISSTNNFSIYRQLQKEAKGFHIPVLAIHLKDLMFYNTALSDYVYKGDLINFRKFSQLATTLQSVLDQQLSHLCIDQNIELCNTLKLSLDLQYTEEDIYELSLAREPKSSTDNFSVSNASRDRFGVPLSSPVSKQSVLFGEFVSGVKPPTVDVLKQHINGMVEAVFKVYDHDKDGLISSDEFEQFAENFPFIDSFVVLDADKDGVISKHEMRTYFLKANYNALKNSFKHEFHEITYFKPTFCSHCTGLLWGLIKQGWRCRDCGANVHKHCKDVIVMECRSRPNMLQHLRSASQSTESANSHHQTFGYPPCNNGQITIDRKRRMSQQRKRRMFINVETQTNDLKSDFEIDNIDPFLSKEKYSERVVIPYLFGAEDDVFDETIKTNDGNYSIDKLLAYKEEKNKELQKEIEELHEKIRSQNDQIQLLQETVSNLRRRTVQFVLNIMDVFNSG